MKGGLTGHLLNQLQGSKQGQLSDMLNYQGMKGVHGIRIFMHCCVLGNYLHASNTPTHPSTHSSICLCLYSFIHLAICSLTHWPSHVYLLGHTNCPCRRWYNFGKFRACMCSTQLFLSIVSSRFWAGWAWVTLLTLVLYSTTFYRSWEWGVNDWLKCGLGAYNCGVGRNCCSHGDHDSSSLPPTKNRYTL